MDLIWDFDGTLFDSYPHVVGAYLQALADFGRTADPEVLLWKLKVLNMWLLHLHIMKN